MKESLSEKEEQLIPVIRDKWLDLAFKNSKKGIDTEKFEKGINWLYDRFLKLPPPTVVYCDSLIDAVLKITLVKDYGKELSDFTPQLLNDYNEGTLDNDFIKKIEINLELKSTYIGWSSFGWVSFYDYFSEIGVLQNEDFNNYKELIESNIYECFEFEFAVFAVKPPIEIIRNSENQLHNIDGYSCLFADGSKFYHLNGFSLSEDLFLKLESNTYTFKEFLKESNEEIKSAAISFIQEKRGDSGVYDFMKENLSEVDSYVDVKEDEFMKGTTNGQNIGVYTLFKGEISGIKIAYVRCFCPSTDRMFFLGVEPKHTSAINAIASLYQVPMILRDKIVSISRQGEKFSTIFDDETTKKLENGFYSKAQIQQYTSISGEDYFSLIKYEF